MADTQQEPAIEQEDGTIDAAQQAILGLLNSSEQPETEQATTTEELESTETPDEESEAEEQELVYEVRVDGETRQVSLDELLNGYSRQSSFTKNYWISGKTPRPRIRKPENTTG